MRRKRTDSLGEAEEVDGGAWEGSEKETRLSSCEEGLIASREERREELKAVMEERRVGSSSRMEERVYVVRWNEVGCLGFLLALIFTFQILHEEKKIRRRREERKEERNTYRSQPADPDLISLTGVEILEKEPRLGPQRRLFRRERRVQIRAQHRCFG